MLRNSPIALVAVLAATLTLSVSDATARGFHGFRSGGMHVRSGGMHVGHPGFAARSVRFAGVHHSSFFPRHHMVARYNYFPRHRYLFAGVGSCWRWVPTVYGLQHVNVCSTYHYRYGIY